MQQNFLRKLLLCLHLYKLARQVLVIVFQDQGASLFFLDEVPKLVLQVRYLGNEFAIFQFNLIELILEP